MSNIVPYFINSPVLNGKSPNILFSDVYQGNMAATSAGNISITDGIIYLPLSGYYFPKRITDPDMKYDYKAGVAGTNGVYTISTSGVTPVLNKVYKVQIISNDGTINQTIPVISSSTSNTTFASDINTALVNASQAGFYTSAVVGTTVTITESQNSTQGFDIIIFGDTNITTGVTTANVPAFGTLAQVQLYKPSITSGGPFDLHQFTVKVDEKDFQGTGGIASGIAVIQIWTDTTGANYATATTALKQFGDGGTYWPTSYCSVNLGNYLNLPK